MRRMIETPVPATTRKANVYDCDRCSHTIKPRAHGPSVYECKMCKRDLCCTCVYREYEDGGDYSTDYCKECWDLGDEFREWLQEQELEESRRYHDWKDKCKPLTPAPEPLDA